MIFYWLWNIKIIHLMCNRRATVFFFFFAECLHFVLESVLTFIDFYDWPLFRRSCVTHSKMVKAIERIFSLSTNSSSNGHCPNGIFLRCDYFCIDPKWSSKTEIPLRKNIIFNQIELHRKMYFYQLLIYSRRLRFSSQWASESIDRGMTTNLSYHIEINTKNSHKTDWILSPFS